MKFNNCLVTSTIKESKLKLTNSNEINPEKQLRSKHSPHLPSRLNVRFSFLELDSHSGLEKSPLSLTNFVCHWGRRVGASQNLFAHACSPQHSIWFNFPSTTCLFLLKLTQDVSALPAQFTLPFVLSAHFTHISWHILIGFPFFPSICLVYPTTQQPPRRNSPKSTRKQLSLWKLSQHLQGFTPATPSFLWKKFSSRHPGIFF